MPDQGTTTRFCRTCGGTFTPTTTQIRRGVGFFCSTSCASSWPPPETRFWANVEKTGSCWLWTGSLMTSGYGRMAVKGRHVGAHRFAYEIQNGPIPDGLNVCHSCDVKRCVRGDHLWLGDARANVHDALKKGRLRTGDRHPLRVNPERAARGERSGYRLHPEHYPKGEARWGAKLTSSAVIAMRNEYAGGDISFKALAAKYGVTAMAAHHAVRGKTWKHV